VATPATVIANALQYQNMDAIDRHIAYESRQRNPIPRMAQNVCGNGKMEGKV
jgi:hypothetical protein